MTFVSYAQNFEDVLLWRALATVKNGFYIDIGAWHPAEHSVTRVFYDKGWSGINIEPIPDLIDVFALQRPRDVNLAVAVAARSTETAFFVVDGTGLSTVDEEIASAHAKAGFSVTRIEVPTITLAEICQVYAPPIIHFLKVDCEGSERDALLGADFKQFRPWILVIEATKPNSPEPNHGLWEAILLSSDYDFVWFDGLNRFYVAAEQREKLGAYFQTPPNVFDDFIRVAEQVRRFQEPPTRPSIASSVPRMLTERQRINLTARCRDADIVPKVMEAGAVVVQDGQRLQIMHNGLKVIADAYYGEWMTELIGVCGGHHEPQEERCFYEVLRCLPSNATMIELGGFWAYYTAWFLQNAPGRRAVVLEPEPVHRKVGEQTLGLNGLSAAFMAGFAARHSVDAAVFRTEKSGVLTMPGFAVPDLMRMHQFEHLDILHCDIQGAELDVLEGCRALLTDNAIRWVFVSTHAWLISGDPLIHQRCLNFLRDCGGTIEAEHDVYESFSGDGLIVARFGGTPDIWRPVSLSYARTRDSYFRNPSFDLAEAREWDARREFIGDTVQALYKTLLLREPDEASASAWIAHLLDHANPLQAVTLMLESAEFKDKKKLFSDHYFGQLEASVDEKEAVNSVYVDCTELCLTFLQDCRLGSRGERILMPTDHVIRPAVQDSGAWNFQQVEYLSSKVKDHTSYILMDIGANVGLFSRQIVRQLACIDSCFCVEPDPENYAALNFNTQDLLGGKVHTFNFGLGIRNGTEVFYRDLDNCGNYSFHADAMRGRPYKITNATTVDTAAWLAQTVPTAGRLVWKSDTQGSDELIIALTPPDLWSRVDAAVIELWRIRKPVGKKQAFLDKIALFPYLSLGLDRSVTVQEVASYLDGDDWAHEDLYMWR